MGVLSHWPKHEGNEALPLLKDTINAATSADFENSGSGDSSTMSGGSMNVGTVTQDTISGLTDDEKAQFVVLRGESTGLMQMYYSCHFPWERLAPGIGFVFGYKRITYYERKDCEMGNPAERIYYVVNTSRTNVRTAAITIHLSESCKEAKSIANRTGPQSRWTGYKNQ